jgi:hypothetical protein
MSSIFSPPNPSAIGLRRNKAASGVPRWSSSGGHAMNDSPSIPSSAHNSRPATSDGHHHNGSGDFRSPSSASSINGVGQAAPSNDSPRKRRPLMVTSRSTNMPQPSQASRPYPFMSAQAQGIFLSCSHSSLHMIHSSV